MPTLIIEIRSAEGGADSKLLVREQLNIYSKFATRQGLALEMLSQRAGMVVCRLTGPAKILDQFAQHEGGGMRWQRVPPNEKRGRVHTSTVTVAVLAEPREADVQPLDRDLVIKTTRSGGPGGQHANKTDSAVVVTHKPTGITVRVETKSQHRNKELAKDILRARLAEQKQASLDGRRNSRRRSQLGSGMRADKRRTVAVQRGQVTDHVTGKSTTSKRYLRGDVEALWS